MHGINDYGAYEAKKKKWWEWVLDFGKNREKIPRLKFPAWHCRNMENSPPGKWPRSGNF